MISILVPNWNSGDRLRRLVASASGIPDLEVRVCDNASSDGSADGVAAEVLRPGRNLGFAGAVNALAREASGDVLLVMNPDCELLPGAVAALQAVLDAHPSVAMVGLLLVDGEGRVQEKYAPRPIPTFGSLAAEALLLPYLARRPPAVAATGPVPQVAGAALAIRRNAFDLLGGLDERYWPAWFEDVDLARRARDRGLETWLCAEARVRHEGGYSGARLGYVGLLDCYYGNELRYARTHLGAPAALGLRGAIAAGMLMRIVAAVVVPPRGVARARAMAAYGAVLGIALGLRRPSSPP